MASSDDHLKEYLFLFLKINIFRHQTLGNGIMRLFGKVILNGAKNQ